MNHSGWCCSTIGCPKWTGLVWPNKILQDPELAPTRLIMLSSTGHGSVAVRCREMGWPGACPSRSSSPNSWTRLLSALGAQNKSAQQIALEAESSTARPPRSLRVLLAEDNPVNQRLVIKLMEKQGHKLVVTGNGKEALAALERDAFDMVLMDVQMPEMGGFDAAETHPRARTIHENAHPDHCDDRARVEG